MAEVGRPKLVTTTDVTYKVKFNATTMIIVDNEKFVSKFNGNDKDNFLFYPDPLAYKNFICGQVVELTKDEYEKVKDRRVLINNERLGDLAKIYKERLMQATPSERQYIEANKQEFEHCLFDKPLVEVIN